MNHDSETDVVQCLQAVATNVKRLMDAKGMTESALAVASGVSMRTIGNFLRPSNRKDRREHSTPSCRLDSLVKIAGALDTEAWVLLLRNPSDAPPTELELDREVLRLVDMHRSEWLPISKIAKVSYSWLYKFAGGKIPNPAYGTLKRLHKLLNGRPVATLLPLPASSMPATLPATPAQAIDEVRVNALMDALTAALQQQRDAALNELGMLSADLASARGVLEKASSRIAELRSPPAR
jgi:transcriptional regulator with XRE-family HTH domain